ncbi:MAG: hypothetical protein K2J66_06650 [Muribaculaceae bacterium]|nr:hypothetical protein [Muribaculaceae bacterium]
MKNIGKRTMLAAVIAATAAGGATPVAAQTIEHGKWAISLDGAARKVTFAKDGSDVLSGVSVRFGYNGEVYDTSDYASATVSDRAVTDKAGDAHAYTITYRSDAGLPDVDQTFLLFDNADYFLTEVTLKSDAKISSNYIAPVYTTEQNLFLPVDNSNRFLTVPFDNDGFVTYGSHTLSCTQQGKPSSGRVARDSISFEVTAIFNGNTQKGLVLGSVEHDNWKSAIRMSGSPVIQSYMSKIEAYSGATHAATRDHHNDDNGGFVAPHGSLSGTEVKSARFMVGLFDDWRTGMEIFGEINNVYAPKRPWNGTVPFGWNSWGGMGFNVNYEGVLSLSDYIKDHYQGKNNFAPDNVVFITLDSGWNNFNWDELKEFSDRCRANGQIAGIYDTPFTNWGHGDGDMMEGNNGYYWGDCTLKLNGQSTGHLDPTHPGTLSRINYYIDRFKALGFGYIKLDFLNHGSQEADSWYDPNVTTGIQAYNVGMKHIAERCGDDFFIDLSISPLFPAQYANARRISCDAWGEMWHTNYMMNSLSFGWWLDRVYTFNDPDHICMNIQTDEENMQRMTSAVCTGFCMLGDNLTTAGSYPGFQMAFDKADKYFQYPEINKAISLGRSFRPAYGHKLYGPNSSVDLFYLETDDSWYIAYFNYGEAAKSGYLDLSTLGIDADNVDTARSKELWFDKSVNIDSRGLQYEVNFNEAKLYHLYKKQ